MSFLTSHHDSQGKEKLSKSSFLETINDRSYMTNHQHIFRKIQIAKNIFLTFLKTSELPLAKSADRDSLRT